jgi:drug/metabolite transporter (DMT)-like permease
MVVAGFLFACMGVFVKLGAQYFSSAELVFYRSLFGLIVMFIIIRSRGLPLATDHLPTHLWRGLSGFVALMLFFYAISRLPLATAITLNYTSPLFLALLSTVVLKEHPRRLLLSALLLGFVGIVLLLRPTLHQGQVITGLLGLGSGFLAGVAYFNVRQLGLRGEPEWRVVFYFTLIATVGAGLWMLLHVFHPLSLHGFLLLLGLGGSATLAQLAMTRAYRLGHTLVVAGLAYSTVLFATLLGIAVWHEMPSAGSWLAIAFIAASGVLSVRATPRPPKA